MSPLTSLARALGGTVTGNSVLCPGPGHSARDRSLSVMLSPSAPDGFLVFSHSGDDPLAAKDYVRQRLGWERHCSRPRRELLSTRVVPFQPDDAGTAKIARAVAIWNEAVDPSGTVVEHYLKRREIELPIGVACDALRFHPRCPWRDETTGETIRVPAMVAAMRSIATEEITGVHRTRLTPDARKVDRRMLGKASGAAIMLAPFSAIGSGLTIGEGIETCLAAAQLGWSNVWALGSVGAIASFPIVAGISSITLLAETGDGGASVRAIENVGQRYEAAGREVLVMSPRFGNDINDAIQWRRA